MKRGRYNGSRRVAGTPVGDQFERRAINLQQVRDLIAAKPHSTFDLSAALHIPASTIYSHLRWLRDLGEARQLDGVDGRGRKLWAADRKPLEETQNNVDEHATRARIVRAEQVGMWRDPLVAAMFGPVRAAA